MSTIDAIPRDATRAGLAARRVGDGLRRRALPAAARILAWFAAALARRRSRLDLMELTDAQLRDIGVTPRQARREGMKRFWE